MNLDTEYDPIGDTISMPAGNANDLAEDEDNADAGQSAEAPDEGIDQDEGHDGVIDDLDEPQFAYTDKDGNEVQLTGRQIVELLEKRQETQASQEVKTDEEKPAEPPKEELPFEIVQIDYTKVGSDLVAMLNGENGGEAALGPAVAELQFQTFVQDPRYAFVLERAIDKLLAKREQERQKQEGLRQLVGNVQEQEIAAFQKANPWATTKELAMIGMQLAKTKAELDRLKGQSIKQVEQAKREHENIVLRNLRAKQGLRTIGAGRHVGASSINIKQKYDLTNDEQRSRAMAEFIEQLRSGNR